MRQKSSHHQSPPPINEKPNTSKGDTGTYEFSLFFMIMHTFDQFAVQLILTAPTPNVVPV